MADGLVDVLGQGTVPVDVTTVSTGSGTVNRQRAAIGDDPDGPVGIARVKSAAPALGDYGLVVRSSGEAVLNYHLITVAGNNAAAISPSARRIFGWSLYNNAVLYPVFVKLYDLGSSPNVGAAVPLLTLPVQAGVARQLHITGGILLLAGLAIAVTKGIADTDNTPVLVNDCALDIFYK